MSTGFIDYPGEIETWGPVHLYPGVEYVAYATGASSFTGSLADPALAVYDAYGNVAVADDSYAYPNEDAAVFFTVPYEGDYVMDVGDLTGGTGSYTANLLVSQGFVPVSDPPQFGPYTDPYYEGSLLNLDPDPYPFGFI